MNAATLTFARSNGRPRRVAFDHLLLLTVAGLLLLGLVMMTSASVSIADKQTHDPLYYLTRQLTGVGLGIVGAAIMMMIPTSVWERLAMPLLLVAFVLLLLVLIPG